MTELTNVDLNKQEDSINMNHVVADAESSSFAGGVQQQHYPGMITVNLELGLTTKP